MSVKRYAPSVTSDGGWEIGDAYPVMLEEADGDYVKADDYDRLRGELAEARRLIEYAYNEMGGAWPAADAFLAEKP